jgi:polyhydroxyalkanoate synthesis regulator phasin
MPSLAQVHQTFPETYEAFIDARNRGTWKGTDFNDWLMKTIERNPGLDISRYYNFGTLPEGRADPVGDTQKAAASEKSYEQDLFDQVDKNYIQPAIASDTANRTLADQLAKDARSDYNLQRGLANQALGPTFNSDAYFAANPDVAEAYAKQAPDATTGLKMTPQEFAQNHYETYGKAEGRQGEYTSRLQREYTSADQTRDSLIDSSSAASTERKATLERQIAALRESLDVNQQAKADALQAQLDSLNSNIDTRAADQLTALQSEIDAMRGSLDVNQQAKADALQAQIAALGSNIDTYDTAQKAALVSEITKLTAAQLPVSQARIAAAENLVSGINLGLEQTRDQLTSDQAAQGYIGGSSAQQGNLARAVIGARQNAAQTRSQADIANADDMRTIASRSATEGRTIDNSTASNRFGLDNYGANTSYADALYGSSEGRRLSDELAGRTGQIQNAKIGDKYNVGTYGANTSYANVVSGANDTRSISDLLTNNTSQIEGTSTQEQQAARDAAAARKSAYFDADYTRQLGTALTLPSLTTNLTNNLGSLNNFSSSGLDKALQTLNWWNTGSTAPSAQTAQYQAYADQTGANIAGLGTGLLGSAVSIGNANNWWQKKTPAADTSKSGGDTNTIALPDGAKY